MLHRMGLNSILLLSLLSQGVDLPLLKHRHHRMGLKPLSSDYIGRRYATNSILRLKFFKWHRNDRFLLRRVSTLCNLLLGLNLMKSFFKTPNVFTVLYPQ